MTQVGGPAWCLARNHPLTRVNFLPFPHFFFNVSSPENIGLLHSLVPEPWTLEGKGSSPLPREGPAGLLPPSVPQEKACPLQESLQGRGGSGGLAAWRARGQPWGRHLLSVPLATDHRLPVSDHPTSCKAHTPLHPEPSFSRSPPTSTGTSP